MVGLTPAPGVGPCDEGRPRATAGAACSIVGGRYGPPPSGVAVRPEGDDFCLVLLGGDGRLLLRFGPYPEEDVVAAWRALALAAGLPLLVPTGDGDVLAPVPHMGRVRLGTASRRRKHVLLAGRRPRFLTRRKIGRFPRRPRVHREAEIAAGLGA